MIRITSLKLNIGHSEKDLKEAVLKKLRLTVENITDCTIVKKSLDARDKENICWNYIIDAEVKNEESVLRIFKNNRNISRAADTRYVLPQKGRDKLPSRPCVIGSGPAGLFCAYFLAKEGYRPVLIEQGQCVEDRVNTIKRFWDENSLNPLSNVQFGEGGAGTFSDGKLNTGVNDKNGRNRIVLETFIQNGAPEEILYMNKPHIGTDVLAKVIVNMRKSIAGWGGDVLFNTKFVDFAKKDGRVISIALEKEREILIRPCSVLVLALGHSARDTFYMLGGMGLDIEAKAFAVGIRAEHKQEDINRAMYGDNYRELYKDGLPPADYKLTYRAKDGRGVYTFCMCPGGYVVNASSEEGALCVNGMSYSKRDGENANSAIIVAVTPEDTGADKDPMAGIEFQRELERKAYEKGKGLIPCQRLEDFSQLQCSDRFGRIIPESKGRTEFADINRILPDFICSDIREAFEAFGKKIRGFDDPDTVLSAVESRTSSPIRILRDSNLESNIKGIFPAGEGAGYAGGIVSSAIDGIKVFEEIYRRYSG